MALAEDADRGLVAEQAGATEVEILGVYVVRAPPVDGGAAAAEVRRERGVLDF